MDKTGGNAFPSHGSMGEVVQEGMTLRDYMAAKAVTGLLSANILETIGQSGMIGQKASDYIGLLVYSIADGMIKARGE